MKNGLSEAIIFVFIFNDSEVKVPRRSTVNATSKALYTELRYKKTQGLMNFNIAQRLTYVKLSLDSDHKVTKTTGLRVLFSLR